MRFRVSRIFCLQSGKADKNRNGVNQRNIKQTKLNAYADPEFPEEKTGLPSIKSSVVTDLLGMDSPFFLSINYNFKMVTHVIRRPL